MKIDVSKLMYLAQRATPGKRTACLGSGNHLMTAIKVEDSSTLLMDLAPDAWYNLSVLAQESPEQHLNNLRFYEAFDPETVLELLRGYQPSITADPRERLADADRIDRVEREYELIGENP